MIRICRQCRTEYDGDPGSTLCPSCVREGRKNTIRNRICRTCGITFPGGPRAWYCPTCRSERTRARDRDFKKSGPVRKLGSTDICTVCGGEYTVTAGLQKYCPTCAPDAIRAVDREQGRSWYAENGDPDQRRQDRQTHAAQLICTICGKPFVPTDASVTCSKECQAALRKRNAKQYEHTHQEKRNAQHRANLKARLEAMSPKERELHRLETNRRARENYKKRKEKKHD